MKKFLTALIAVVSLGLLTSCAQVPETTQKPISKKTETDDLGGSTPNPKNPTSSSPETPDNTTPAGHAPINKPPTQNPSTDPPKTDPIKQEPPSEEPVVKTNLVGGIDPLNAFIRIGEITGWAVDKDNLRNYLMVNIYFDGDNKTGVKVGSTKANLIGSDENNGGEHAFIFALPTQFRDGKPHKVYAYAVMNDKEVLLSSKLPHTLTFYSPKGGAAKAAFDKLGFGNCVSCHGYSYDSAWSRLVQDGPSGKPLSAENNDLYEKIKIRDPGHRLINGKRLCGNINCEGIKDWFRLEFAQ